MTVIEAPMRYLMRCGEPLYRDGSLGRDEDAADTLGNERTKQIVHRHEGEPEVEVLAEPEHVDLIALINR
jgi:hypothetical protein